MVTNVLEAHMKNTKYMYTDSLPKASIIIKYHWFDHV